MIYAITLFILFIYFNNNYLHISKYNIVKKGLNKDLNGLKIVHLSDLHNKQFGKNQKIILKKIKKLNPDIIVFTGDLIGDLDLQRCAKSENPTPKERGIDSTFYLY